MQQRTSTEPSDQQRGSGQPSVLGMGPNPEPTALFSGGLPGFASNEPTVSAMPDGTGWYQQEVFYATDRDFDPNNKKYGTKQHIPLRYGVVPVRIPKKREPGHDSAYNVPINVRSNSKDYKFNGRYNVSLYEHRSGGGIGGPKPLTEDYAQEYDGPATADGSFESFRVEFSKSNCTYRPCIASRFAWCPGVGAQSGIKESACFEHVNRGQASGTHFPPAIVNRGKDARARFFQEVQQALRDSVRKEIVVFVHGYNVSHEGALKSAAQLVFDTAQDYSTIDYPGKFVYLRNQRVAVAFDWSSHSSLPMYGFVPCIQDDRERAEEAGPKLAHLLLDLAEAVNIDGCVCNGIHIVAHSMGNYVLHYAMQHLSGICPHTPVGAEDAGVLPSTVAGDVETAAAVAAPVSATEAAAGPAATAAAIAPNCTLQAAAARHMPDMSATRADTVAELGLPAAVPVSVSTSLEPKHSADMYSDVTRQADQQSPGKTGSYQGLSRAVAAIAAVTEDAAAESSRVSRATSNLGMDNDAAAARPASAGSADDRFGIAALLGPTEQLMVASDGAASPTRAAAVSAADVTAGSAMAEGVEDVPPIAEPTAEDYLPAAAETTTADREPLESYKSSPFTRLVEVSSTECQPPSHDGPAAGGPSNNGRLPRAISAAALIHHPSGKKLFRLLRTVIHAAADVGREDMEHTIMTVRTGANVHSTPQPNITTYSSRRDQALCVSSFLRAIGKDKRGRAGFFMRQLNCFEGHVFHPFLFNGVVCVDATGFSQDRLGHGYFRDHRQVLTDITHAFEGRTAPPARTTLRESKDGEEWKCQRCNDRIAPDPAIVMYRVMTVSEQHDQQLQLCRMQLKKLTQRMEDLKTSQDLPAWQNKQQQFDSQLSKAAEQSLEDQVLDARQSLPVQRQHKGPLSLLRSWLQ